MTHGDLSPCDTDCRNLQKSFIESFKFPFSAIGDSQLAKVGKNLFVDYEKKEIYKIYTL